MSNQISEEPFGEFGFLYNDIAERDNEFALAAKYFEENPGVIKMSRKTPLIDGAESTIVHSYIKIGEKIVAIAHGEGRFLGTGSFGRVKFAMDQNGDVYALKIENKDSPQTETQILDDLGLLHGNKVSRATSSQKTDTKYYTLMEYLGKNYIDYLNSILQNAVAPITDDRIRDARKIAWELHKLHNGASTKSKTPIAHLDVKLDNVVRLENGKIRLIDFGFSETIQSDWYLSNPRGTQQHLPLKLIKNNDRLQPVDSEAQVIARMNRMGQIRCDVFALKRCIYYPYNDYRTLLNKQELTQLPSNLRRMLDTEDVDRINNVTALDITYELIKYEMSQLHPGQQFNPDPQFKEDICKCFGLLDEFTENLSAFSSDTLNAYIKSYQEKINSCNSLDELQLLHTNLETLQNYIADLQPYIKDLHKIQSLAVNDQLIKNKISDILNLSNPESLDIGAIKQEIGQILQKVDSEKVSSSGESGLSSASISEIFLTTHENTVTLPSDATDSQSGDLSEADNDVVEKTSSESNEQAIEEKQETSRERSNDYKTLYKKFIVTKQNNEPSADDKTTFRR